MASASLDAQHLVTESAVLGDIPLVLPLEPNSRYTFKYLIYFSAPHGIALSVSGPLRPTFSGFKAETPLHSSAVPLLFGWGGNFVTATPVQGHDGVVQLEGVIRTGAAGGTLLPRFASKVGGFPATVKAASKGELYDQGT